MFDIGFWELALISVIALLVVGPERLPAMARTVGFWVGRIRRYVSHVRDDIEREIRADEMREMMKEASRIESFDEDLSETRDALTAVKEEVEEAGESLSGEVDKDARESTTAMDAAASSVGETIANENELSRGGDDRDESTQSDEGSTDDERRSG